MELIPLAGLVAGLVGSPHCLGMCGGLAAGLASHGEQVIKPVGELSTRGFSSHSGSAAGARRNPRNDSSAFYSNVIAINAGRVATYTLLGVIVGAVGDSFRLLPASAWVLRVVAGLLMILIGLQTLSGRRLLTWIEAPGRWIWRQVAPLATRAAGRPSWVSRAITGACWGLLPCGLVYSGLILAGTTQNAALGGLTMLMFGFGTLPSMVGVGLFAASLTQRLSSALTHRLAGAILIAMGIWTLAVPLWRQL